MQRIYFLDAAKSAMNSTPCTETKGLLAGAELAGSRAVTSTELKARTKRFALDIITFARGLPTDQVTAVLTRQIVKSGSSVGANYRSACRAKSKADFISKMSIAEDEADETQFWLEVLSEGGSVKTETIVPLIEEADQLVRIFVTSINTARGGPRR
jgi:four helix bundle protein